MASKILVVDDEPHLRRVVSLYLRARHYEVDTAENGLEAIQKVADDRPDLVIADIGIPASTVMNCAAVSGVILPRAPSPSSF